MRSTWPRVSAGFTLVKESSQFLLNCFFDRLRFSFDYGPSGFALSSVSVVSCAFLLDLMIAPLIIADYKGVKYGPLM